MESRDPLTGEVFIPGRGNQKFASRSNQIRFNNLKAARKRRAKANVDRVHDRNRTILKRVLGNRSDKTLSRDYLLGAGFDFTCFTHSTKKVEGICHCVYEFGYINTGENSFKIFKHEERD